MKKCLLSLCLGLVALMGSSDLIAQVKVMQLYAHRGSRFEFDENTMHAFKSTYEAGFRRFETDIRMTKDGLLVLSHDASLKRLTPCERDVETMTAEEVRKVKTKQGNDIAFLNDLTDYLADKDSVFVEFEMKTNAPESAYPEERLREYCSKVYDMIMAKKPANSMYLFTSFDPKALKMMQSLHPDADLLLIVSKGVSDETIQQAKELGVKRLGARLDKTTKEYVKKANKEGLTVSLYPGKTPEDFVQAYLLGANSMTTDCALEVRKFLQTKATFVPFK